MNGIQSWLKRNGCTFNAGGDTAMTHTIMSGGTLYVPEDLYDEFLGVYAAEIERGNRTLAYSEKRSPDVFRMYFDLDILDHKELHESEILEIVREVHRTTSLFFEGATDETLKCVVSRTSTKEIQVETKERAPEKPHVEGEDPVPEPPIVTHHTLTKNGVHLNFPKLLVNMDMALQIRFSVVNRLEAVKGPRPVEYNPWSDVIDKAPYFNGLKMIGSVKRDQCDKCCSSKKKGQVRGEKEVERRNVIKEIARVRRKYYKRDDDAFDYSSIMTFNRDEYRNFELATLHTQYHALTTICQQCNNKGWFLEDRFYSASHVLSPGGALCCDDLAYIQKDYHEQMRWTSIRARQCDQITPGYAVPPGHPAPTADTTSACLDTFGSAALEWVSPGLYREILSSDVHVADVKGHSRWKGSVIKDKATIEMIAKCVRGMHDSYSNIVIKEAMELKTGKKADETKKKITKGAAAGMTFNKPRSKAGENMLSKMMTVNNTTLNKDVIIRVYTSVVVRVSGQGSKFCQNKGGEHTSNSVYFCISKNGITQMCHSGKDTPGLSGKTCRKYHSASKGIPIGLSKKLFPEEFGIDINAMQSSLGKRGAPHDKPNRRFKKKQTRQTVDFWKAMC